MATIKPARPWGPLVLIALLAGVIVAAALLFGCFPRFATRLGGVDRTQRTEQTGAQESKAGATVTGDGSVTQNTEQRTTNVTIGDAGWLLALPAGWFAWSRRSHRKAVARLVHSIERADVGDGSRATLKNHIRDKAIVSYGYWPARLTVDPAEQVIRSCLKRA